MQKLTTLFLFFLPLLINAQLKIGIKAGLNFANITNAADVKANSRTGYMFGGFISPKAKLLGFRSEIMLSRQGYNFKSSTNTGNVNLDYLLLPQLITLNFGKKIQLHAGGQLAFLLNSTVDSSGAGSGNGSLFDYFNRFDYGLVAGAEISPFLGFFIGGRINTSFNNVNKESPIGGNWPNFIPRIDAKNNVVQLYTGWRF